MTTTHQLHVSSPAPRSNTATLDIRGKITSGGIEHDAMLKVFKNGVANVVDGFDFYFHLGSGFPALVSFLQQSGPKTIAITVDGGSITKIEPPGPDLVAIRGLPDGRRRLGENRETTMGDLRLELRQLNETGAAILSILESRPVPKDPLDLTVATVRSDVEGAELPSE